jgi:glycosyltransferase involved in cell wall biosynthesis
VNDAKADSGAAMNGPLVTFALLSYNQERFIRDAVRAALAQTYSPLQIVISDDCSQDMSFEILQEELADYEGPHQILLNRNERNLGTGGNVNRVMELAKGELVVVAAGDDVSLPTRTEVLASIWSAGGIYCVWSSLRAVDEVGRVGNDLPARFTGSWQEIARREPKGGGVGGASAAWDRTVFDVFGPLPDGAVHEDYTFEFRAALLGKIAWTTECLVKYRLIDRKRAPDPTDLSRDIANHTKHALAFAVEYEGWLRDLSLFLAAHPEMKSSVCRAMEHIAARMEYFRFKVFATKSVGTDRLRGCLRIVKYARLLGIKSTMKACLLAVSPMTYFRMQRFMYRSLGISPLGW